MRYSGQHKDAVRARIVEAASRQFRRAGLQGVAIGDIMGRLRLTHGGFYRHFASKEQLFEEALDASVSELGRHLVAIADASPDRPLAAIIDAYLSEEHCDDWGKGCPLAALSSDIARLPRRSREVCHRLLMSYARDISRFMPAPLGDARQHQAAVLFSAMSGTLTLARTMSDRTARAALLAGARAFFHRTAD